MVASPLYASSSPPEPRGPGVVLGFLVEEEEDAAAEPDSLDPQKDNNLNLAVQELNDRDRQAFGISNGGVIVRDVMNGPAFDAGIAVGDVILELANKKVTGFNSYKLITRNLKKGSVVPVLISRQKSPLYIALRIPAD